LKRLTHAHNFQTNAANLCSITPTAAIADLNQRQQPWLAFLVFRANASM
jgi:uncharacterized protein YcbX